MNDQSKYDVIVIGGGHAGIEAAYAAARMGSKTALVSLDLNKIGYMPCNPAIGGIGKGHIVFEISALGGLMPKTATKTYLQAKMLNTKKGPAVHGLRLQIDKIEYAKESKRYLDTVENLTFITDMVHEFLVDESNAITGILCSNGTIISAQSVVLTTGTFLNGLVHVGLKNYASGREDEAPTTFLSQCIKRHGFTMGRLKTGTPPRLKGSTVDFSVMQKQESDTLHYLFEFDKHTTTTKKDCYITRTNENVHNTIKENAHLSPILRKDLEGLGPRYCPSIEDKITRFPDKDSHQIFVEPESMSTDWLYPNGLSTSLPLEAQEKYIRAIKGFENAEIVRPGYAIEYDFVHPSQLKHTLETKKISGLFFAGQINGTTGYEEAAGQGIIAGINAHLTAHALPAFILDRTESYIGVMIDDLVTLGIDEPYRMFTSRAERRLLLRQDNVFLRLTEKAYNVGLVSQEMYEAFLKEKKEIEETLKELKEKYLETDLLRLFENNETAQETVLKITGKDLPHRCCQTIQASIKYAPYIEREEREVARLKKYQTMILPATLIYKGLHGLSIELQQKLEKVRPATIAQANLIPGMTPAALSFLMMHMNILEKSTSNTK